MNQVQISQKGQLQYMWQKSPRYVEIKLQNQKHILIQDQLKSIVHQHKLNFFISFGKVIIVDKEEEYFYKIADDLSEECRLVKTGKIIPKTEGKCIVEFV